MSFAQDLRAVMWKETRELVRQRSTLVSSAFLLAMFGVVLPLQVGPEFLTTLASLPNFVILPFATLIAFIADAFAGERERHTLESLLATRLSDRSILVGKIATAVAYGWLLALVEAVVALVAVNASSHAPFAFYRPLVLAAGLGFGFLVALLMASLGVLVSLRSPTVRQAQQLLGLSVALVGVLTFAGARILPASLRAPLLKFFATAGEATALAAVAGALLAVDVVLLALCAWRFQRSKLVLD